MQTTKVCSDVNCRLPRKNASEFREGRSRCRECEARVMREYKIRFPDRVRESQRKYHQKHEWKIQHTRSIGIEYRNHPEKWWYRTIKKLYGMTSSDYTKLLSQQESRCAICGKHQQDLSRRLSVDHNHSCCSGKTSCGKCIRGLLCDKCNHGLGQFNDSVYLLKNAIQYINKGVANGT